MQAQAVRSTERVVPMNPKTESLWEEVACNLCGSRNSKVAAGVLILIGLTTVFMAVI